MIQNLEMKWLIYLFRNIYAPDPYQLLDPAKYSSIQWAPNVTPMRYMLFTKQKEPCRVYVCQLFDMLLICSVCMCLLVG